MRIGCIGNMNNNMFAIVRLLRDRGLDAHLLPLDHELDHFHPSADAFDLEYQRYTRPLSWGAYPGFLRTPASRIAAELSGFDALIGCGSAPAFLWKAGRALDIFVPYGDDVYDFPNPRVVNPRWQLQRVAFSRAQRAGIRAAAYMHMVYTNPESERIIERTGRRGPRLLLDVPMVYAPLYDPDGLRRYYDRSHWYHQFRRIRQEHELVVFSHARHHWFDGQIDREGYEKINYKGNDRLIRGFAQFVTQSPGTRAALVTCEYGPSVLRSKALAHDLGVADRVFWFPRMLRKDIMIGLAHADFGAGEFGTSFFTCGTVYEALAMGRPLLHHRDDALYREAYPSMYPLVNANAPERIAETFHDFVRNPAPYRAMGAAGRRWLEEHVITRPIDTYVQILTGARPAATAAAAGHFHVQTP